MSRSFVHDDDAAAAGHGARRGEGVEIERDVLQADLFFLHRAVGFLRLDLVAVARLQHLGRGAAGDERLEFAPALDAAADVVEELAQGERADLEFVVARFLDVAADAEKPRAGVVGLAESWRRPRRPSRRCA
jgi:hypothetical protein